MKKFEGLNHFQREDAIKLAFFSIVDSITCGVIEIELVHEENQKALNKILTTYSGRMVTLSILAHKGIRSELERLALVAASESEYSEDGRLLKEGKDVDPILN